MRGLIHICLAVVVAIAPALCCCQSWLMAGHRVTTLPNSNPVPANPQPSSSSCCHVEKIAKPANSSSCCQEELSTSDEQKPSTTPPAKTPSRCCCSTEHVVAVPSKSELTLAPLEWTGELVSFALVGIVGFSPEHLGLVGGLLPPERAGVDTRSAALFERHVMRC